MNKLTIMKQDSENKSLQLNSDLSAATMQKSPYSLVLRFASDGIALSIYQDSSLISSKKIKMPLYALTKEQIFPLLLQEPETQLLYDKIRLIAETKTYSIVPKVIFKEEEMDKLLYFSHQKEKNVSLLYNEIPAFDVINIFSLPEDILEVFRQLFPAYKIEHSISHFMENHISKHSLQECIFIWARQKIMDVVALQHNRLLLVNSFDFQTHEDFVYYLLRIIEELNFDLQNCKVYLYNMEQHAKLHGFVRKFVKQCETID